MSPVQKEAPPANKPPAISLPDEKPAAKAPGKSEPGEKAAGAPANKAQSAAKPQEKSTARPKRPVHRGPAETERITREGEQYRQYYPAPPRQSYQPYQRGYEETWRESEGPAYRPPPPYYGPPRYEREESEVWRTEPYPYRYAPPSYYREVPMPYGSVYRGAPPPPPWAW